MALTTATELKQLILIRIGESDANGTIAGSLNVLWDMYADKALIAPRLQFLYVLCEAIDIKLGMIADGPGPGPGMATSSDVNTANTTKSRVDTWMKLRDASHSEINQILTAYNRVRPVVSGTLTTTAPISPADDTRTVNAPDANDREYRGDAYLGLPYGPNLGRVI